MAEAIETKARLDLLARFRTRTEMAFIAACVARCLGLVGEFLLIIGLTACVAYGKDHPVTIQQVPSDGGGAEVPGESVKNFSIAATPLEITERGLFLLSHRDKQPVTPEGLQADLQSYFSERSRVGEAFPSPLRQGTVTPSTKYPVGHRDPLNDEIQSILCMSQKCSGFYYINLTSYTHAHGPMYTNDKNGKYHNALIDKYYKELWEFTLGNLIEKAGAIGLRPLILVVSWPPSHFTAADPIATIFATSTGEPLIAAVHGKFRPRTSDPTAPQAASEKIRSLD